MGKINTILMIDDSEGDHFLSQAEIDEWSSDVNLLSAYDGREALTLLKSLDSPPDLILLDINMPVMNGHDFLDAYENEKVGDLPPVVVMLTSSDQDKDKQQAGVHACVKDYMLKPLTQEKITALSELYSRWT